MFLVGKPGDQQHPCPLGFGWLRRYQRSDDQGDRLTWIPEQQFEGSRSYPHRVEVDNLSGLEIERNL